MSEFGPEDALEAAYMRGGWEYVKALVDDGRQESRHEEFKQKEDRRTGKPSEKDQQNFAQALSAFANSEGGVVVWGVKADTGKGGVDRVRAIRPIPDPGLFASRLQDYVTRAVSPPVPGVRHRVVQPDESLPGVVLSVIPKSDAAPHMAGSGLDRYYVRIAAIRSEWGISRWPTCSVGDHNRVSSLKLNSACP